MLDASDNFLEALRVAHDVATTVEVWSGGTLQQTINVDGGTVTVDENSKIRRTLSLSCTDIGLDPSDALDLLSPFGSELHVYNGITFASGDTELLPCGVFPITQSTRQSIMSSLSISAADYSQTLDDDRFPVPWNTPAGSAIVDEVARIVNDVYPSVEVYDLAGLSLVTSKATFTGSRLDAVESLVSAAGAEFVFDQYGRGVIRPIQTVDGSPSVWVVTANATTADLLDVETGLDAQGVYNAVVATSSNGGDNPVSAIVYQTSGDLAWRTGLKRPRFYSSPFLNTYDQCVSAATSILARSATYARTVNPTALPNPTLDVGDLVDVYLPDGTYEQRVISRIALPLSPNPMQLGTRVGMTTSSTSDAGSLS